MIAWRQHGICPPDKLKDLPLNVLLITLLDSLRDPFSAVCRAFKNQDIKSIGSPKHNFTDCKHVGI